MAKYKQEKNTSRCRVTLLGDGRCEVDESPTPSVSLVSKAFPAQPELPGHKAWRERQLTNWYIFTLANVTQPKFRVVQTELAKKLNKQKENP